MILANKSFIIKALVDCTTCILIFISMSFSYYLTICKCYLRYLINYYWKIFNLNLNYNLFDFCSTRSDTLQLLMDYPNYHTYYLIPASNYLILELMATIWH